MDATTPDGPNPSGRCLCGCGGRTKIAKVTMRANGWVRGRPVDYVRGHQSHPGLSDDEVRAILAAGASESPRSIARRYGAEEAHVAAILRGWTRKHVAPELPRPLRKADGEA